MSTYDDDDTTNMWHPDSLFMRAGHMAKLFCIVAAGVIPNLLFIFVIF